jgi:hypothetical protein
MSLAATAAPNSTVSSPDSVAVNRLSHDRAVGCAQINVSGGGSGTPGPLVSFPGAYTGYEPGILIDIYNLPSNFTGYVPPGPPVWPSYVSNSYERSLQLTL